MLRMLGPHQGIRLERLRSELDDYFENHELSLAYSGEDHTRLVEKQLPAIQSTIETESSASVAETNFLQNKQSPPADLVMPQEVFNQNMVPPVTQTETFLNIEDAASLLSSPPSTTEASPVRAVVENLPLPTMVPAPSTPATSASMGYEWLTQGESNYFRLVGSQTEWTIWEE